MKKYTFYFYGEVIKHINDDICEANGKKYSSQTLTENLKNFSSATIDPSKGLVVLENNTAKAFEKLTIKYPSIVPEADKIKYHDKFNPIPILRYCHSYTEEHDHFVVHNNKFVNINDYDYITKYRFDYLFNSTGKIVTIEAVTKDSSYNILRQKIKNLPEGVQYFDGIVVDNFTIPAQESPRSESDERL